MLHYISQGIVGWQIRNGYLEQKERSIYEYAYELLLNQVINVLVAVLIAMAYGDYITVILFLVCYIPLRSYAGGYHADTNWGCTIVSAVMLILLCQMGQQDALWDWKWYLFCYTISGLSVYCWAPVSDQNKPLDGLEHARYQKRSRQLWKIEALIGILLFMAELPYANVIARTHVILSVVLCIGICKNKRSHNRK